MADTENKSEVVEKESAQEQKEEKEKKLSLPKSAEQ